MGWRPRYPTAPPFLDALQQAVIEGEQQVLGYVSRERTPTTRVVHPLGLASKGWSWYPVAGTPPGPDGRAEIELSGPTLHIVAASLAGYGADVELIDPPEVRDELAAIAAELVGLYGSGGS